ncbi:SDR family oxidoreductase [Aspergillus ibericus CBS 121593]|uniref:NAD dependent epimerase/dehydratase family protein n=1 Tax=Aspergillus ibericus CBS 121593 TaxID=1448316 RepID=A0A395GQB4_9EURO|nr:NAD dependent epimerase/dehydratase family protein [Aspergillus ibericus CBS 121593]RAK96243.1 NAD dependent epimerase/dehydratase family protein [Aspergillus ibericus CBS 121593]
MPTAIVTGATGILGREIINHLSRDPTYTKIHALSRSPKPSSLSHVHHASIDLLSTPTTLSTQLTSQNVCADYLFFTAYLQEGDEKDLERINGDMLENFLTAMSLSGAEKTLKRVVLVTGAKHYGVHLGPVKNPMEERDPWVEGEGRPPNFYYRQQRILRERGEGRGWDWVVTYPNDVVGVAKGNFMNLVTAIGLYASITKELNAPFIFPGSRIFYPKIDCFTYSRLHARFCAWAAITPACSNQAFNVVNGDAQSWQTMWPRLAERFGVTIPADQFEAEDEKVVPLIERPPLEDYAATSGLKGQVEKGEVRMRIDLEKWMKREDVRGAWERVAEREGLEKDAFEKATWFFLNFVLGRNYDLAISMNKAWKLGFRDWADTWDALEECLDELEEEKVLPRTGRK